jgi:CMP-2-keto-3-deoxyoctulosonic acid synthetase
VSKQLSDRERIATSFRQSSAKRGPKILPDQSFNAGYFARSLVFVAGIAGIAVILLLTAGIYFFDKKFVRDYRTM